MPMQVLLIDTESGVLNDFACNSRLKLPDNVGAGVLTMARIVGYMNRKNDPPLGYHKIREGYIQLAKMLQAYELAYYTMAQNKGWLHHK